MHKVIIVSLCLVALATFAAGNCSLDNATYEKLDKEGKPSPLSGDPTGTAKCVVFSGDQSILVTLASEEIIKSVSYESKFVSGYLIVLKDANGDTIDDNTVKHTKADEGVANFSGNDRAVKKIQIVLPSEGHGEAGIKALKIAC